MVMEIHPVLEKFSLLFCKSHLTLFFLLLLSSLATSDVAVSPLESLYASHCAAVVPPPHGSWKDGDPLRGDAVAAFPALRNAWYGSVAQDNPESQKGIFGVRSKSLSLRTVRAYRTQKVGVFRIDASLILDGVRGQSLYGNFSRRNLRLVYYRPPRIPVEPGFRWRSRKFSLSGYWDSGSGKLCMVGSYSEFSSVHVVLKLDYSNSSSILNGFVNGTLERLDVRGNDSKFKMVSVFGVNTNNYEYTLIDREIVNGAFEMSENLANCSLGMDELRWMICPYIRSASVLELDYKRHCSDSSCDFLGHRNGNLTWTVMSLRGIECSRDGRVRYLLRFGDLQNNGYQLPFEQNSTLLSEGKWNAEKKRLDMVACHISLSGNGSQGSDCFVRLSLRFPAWWTVRNRSAVVGEMWSSRRANEPGYFGRVAMASKKNLNVRFDSLRYEYTEVENVRKSCASKMAKKGKKGVYPDGMSSDMRFDMIVRGKKGEETLGYLSPLFVGDNRYRSSPLFGRPVESGNRVKQKQISEINVSYVLSFGAPSNSKLGEFTRSSLAEISAEGLYDHSSGHLCMIGCRDVGAVGRNSSLDCDILVEIQYPPLNAKKGSTIKGSLESTRDKADPLYFEHLEILSHSIYTNQARETIWRMDLEITMVLISNTLECIFVGLQLFHVSKNGAVLPFISIMMLAVLTLAHMIPLLLNFEALFSVKHNTLYLGSDGWLEVNEVLVRVITMVAFLLEFRLLQLTWSARSNDESQKKLWISDKKVLFLSVPMYVGGGLIAWFAHMLGKSFKSPRSLKIRHHGHQEPSLWGGLKSYAGLILDGFLFPQILFNLFSDSREQALAPSFYIGTTFVRLLPHAYDLYRVHSSTWSFNYIYANPRMDYYSTTWDIIISIGGLLFVVLIFLQQRFGGRCFVPKRFGQSSVYEKVPVISTE